jgi:ferredoxin
MTGATPDNNKCKIHFIPDNVDIKVDRGTILLDAAIAGGVHITASCGGSGVCGTCKVKIVSGDVRDDPDQDALRRRV